MSWSLTRREWLGAAAALLCPSSGTAKDDKGQQVADLVSKARTKHGLAAVLCGVWRGEDEVATLARGSSMTGVPATKEMHLRAGGVTLTCVCTVLLRLADERRVSLDDKLSRWYPKLPQAGAVTLRMLANCTSAALRSARPVVLRVALPRPGRYNLPRFRVTSGGGQPSRRNSPVADAVVPPAGPVGLQVG
jgi:CubicO group peptidase (beta-lactamase class C family)